MKVRTYQDSDQNAIIQLWIDCGLVAPQNNPIKDIKRKNLQIRTSNLKVIAFYESLGYKEDQVTSLGMRLEVDPPFDVDLQTKESKSNDCV